MSTRPLSPPGDAARLNAPGRLALALATGLGSGFSPVAPGTVGSAVAALVYLPLASMFSPARWWEGAGLVLATFLVGVWCADVVEKRLGCKDPGRVVIDEIAGQWLTYLFLTFTWTLWALGFLLFRLFDILKPFPARRLERLPGGWGIMADDLVAGAYAALALAALQRWILP